MHQQTVDLHNYIRSTLLLHFIFETNHNISSQTNLQITETKIKENGKQTQKMEPHVTVIGVFCTNVVAIGVFCARPSEN